MSEEQIETNDNEVTSKVTVTADTIAGAANRGKELVNMTIRGLEILAEHLSAVQEEDGEPEFDLETEEGIAASNEYVKKCATQVLDDALIIYNETLEEAEKAKEANDVAAYNNLILELQNRQRSAVIFSIVYAVDLPTPLYLIDFATINAYKNLCDQHKFDKAVTDEHMRELAEGNEEVKEAMEAAEAATVQ